MLIPATPDVIESVKYFRNKKRQEAFARHGGLRLRVDVLNEIRYIYCGNSWSGPPYLLPLAEGLGNIEETKAKRLWSDEVIFIWSTGRFDHPPQIMAEFGGERYRLGENENEKAPWLGGAQKYYEALRGGAVLEESLSSPRPEPA